MSQNTRRGSLELLSRLILGADGLQFLRALTQGARELYGRLARGGEQGIYEVLDHRTRLELLDAQGEVARVERRQTVRFLQNYVAALTDYAWGEGEVFAEYTCSPGVAVDFYQDGSRQAVLISLREAKSRGDVLKLTTRRKVVGGFTKAEECWETDVYHRTRRLRVAVLFPRGRRCRRATVTQRSTSKTIALGPQHFRFLEDGRQQVTWEIERPRRHDRYSFKWWW